ncbi:hypothetical protein YSA_08137 [Pseudomonas putida ND6]|uniref:Uncharacterized protein n=1 Tax=Pseudomonas putida ND6 TaxID=231023 RepID=I3V099_PSEPU|nr:hypothetical protein YSA_08137 [Pseudomonas putida ND6]
MAHQQAITERNETSRPTRLNGKGPRLNLLKSQREGGPLQKNSERLDHAKAHGFYADVGSQ